MVSFKVFALTMFTHMLFTAC